MNKTLIVVVALVGLFVVVPSCMSIVIYNGLVSVENQIEAAHKDTQNVHANIFQNMKTQNVAVDKYGDMVIKAIDAAIGGRYGEGGSQAAFQWIKENNPTIDPVVFGKLQNVIEAGYSEFKASQTKKLDVIRVYKDKLRTFPSNMVAGMLGFPRIPIAEWEKIVTSKQTKEDFASGELSAPF
jgi:hypothetical protein